MRRFSFLLFLSLFIYSATAANWHVIEGRYSRVEFTTGNRSVADSLLEIAEMAIPRLARMTGISTDSFRDKKTRIILTDAPDVSNGFALGNAVVIYALSSGFALSWSGNDSWYKMVLTHELVHHTVFRATRRKLKVLGAITDSAVPRWFHEGIAQYFAETWNAFRGDIYLKNAILSGQLSYNAIDKWSDGAILYAGGHAFVRWLAWQYGDSSFIKLLRYEPEGWSYDFDDAFEHVYKESAKNLFSEFLRYMIIYYGDRLAAYPKKTFFERFAPKNMQVFDMLPYSQQDSTYIVTAKLDAIHSYRTVMLARLKKTEKLEEIYTITDNFNTDLVISKDKHYAAFGRYNLSTIHDQTGISFDWFIHDLQNKTTVRIARNTRARSAAFTDDNHLILVHTLPESSIILRFSLENHPAVDTLLVTAMPVGYLAAMDNGGIIFDAQRANGWHDLFLLNTESHQLQDLTNDSLINRRPVVLNDSLIAFNRIEDKNLAIAVINLKSRKIVTHINDQYAYWLKNYDWEKRELIVSRWEGNRKAHLFTLPADSLLSTKSGPDLACINPKYISWEHKTPAGGNLGALPDTTLNTLKVKNLAVPQFAMTHLLSAALPFYAGKETGWGLFAMTAWADPLQRQIFQLTLYGSQQGWDFSLILLGHIFRAWNQTFTTSYYHGPVIFSFEEDKYVQTYQDVFSFNWSRPWNTGGNPRVILRPSLSYNGYHYKMKEIRPFLPKNYSYHGPSADFSFKYVLPTKYGAALYKRYAYGRVNFFQSLEPAYNFNITQLDMHLATNIIWEELGLKTRFNYTTTSGSLPPLNRMGIDRFFGIDVPRDLTYTKTVRGVREDLSAKRMSWASAELTYMLAEQSSMKLLFLPLKLLSITAFTDYARLENNKTFNILGYGAEITFGWDFIRLGAGYAIGRDSSQKKNEEFYMRIILATGL